MEKHSIQYNGKKYDIIEPNIETWSKLMTLQDWTDESEFALVLISEMTGLSKEDISKSDWHSVITASQNLSNHLLHESKKFHKDFEFDGVKYRFIDLANLTFGEFVDIDTFLSRSEHDRKREMNLLMAMLYREVDENDKLTGYDSNKIQNRAERFKKLPVRYVNGASTFFLRLEKISQGSFQLSLSTRMKMRIKMILILAKLLASVSIGLGLARLSNWLMKILRRSKK
jgi:hypothetical protein